MMQFTPENCALVAAGLKTQTRRVKKPNERLVIRDGKKTVEYQRADGRWIVKYQVGRTYAYSPGRGKHGVGFHVLRDIREEPVQDISAEDVFAEGVRVIRIVGENGFPPDMEALGVEAYMHIWRGINKRAGTRWQDNPDVFAYTFGPPLTDCPPWHRAVNDARKQLGAGYRMAPDALATCADPVRRPAKALDDAHDGSQNVPTG
jgi:hypothetical protein